jgi:hypothetical protein
LGWLHLVYLLVASTNGRQICSPLLFFESSPSNIFFPTHSFIPPHSFDLTSVTLSSIPSISIYLDIDPHSIDLQDNLEQSHRVVVVAKMRFQVLNTAAGALGLAAVVASVPAVS